MAKQPKTKKTYAIYAEVPDIQAQGRNLSTMSYQRVTDLKVKDGAISFRNDLGERVILVGCKAEIYENDDKGGK